MLGRRLRRIPIQPGLLIFLTTLKTADRIAAFHGQADVIEPIEQAFLEERINLERIDNPVGGINFLLFQICWI